MCTDRSPPAISHRRVNNPLARHKGIRYSAATFGLSGDAGLACPPIDAAFAVPPMSLSDFGVDYCLSSLGLCERSGPLPVSKVLRPMNLAPALETG
jgi:hypothetical protein